MKLTKQPLVSVIMPVYNARRYLRDAIESVRSQTISDFEFLIVDDGSTDSSWELLRSYAKKDKRIRLYRNSPNQGLVGSLNSIISKTRGKYIARMDADDVSLPDRFERQVAILESRPEIVACGGQEYIIDEQGKTIAEKYFPTDPNTCYNMLMNVMVIQPPLLMAQGDVFRKLRYDNHIFKNDDISMHFKLLKYGKFTNVDGIIFKYRRVQNSLTHKNPKKVYFLALFVRLNAMMKWGYRPALANVLLTIPETTIVSVLPNKTVLSLFELIRFTGDSVRKAWMYGASLKAPALAKAAGLLVLLRQ